jgi:hypothetical protein
MTGPGLARNGLRPDPDEARALLRRELAHREYHPDSLQDRIQQWLGDLWERLLHGAQGADGASSAVAIALAVVVVAVLLVTLPRLRRDRTRRSAARGVLDTAGITADDLRRRAETAAADGRHGDALADAVRALVRRSVERGLLDEAPGRTTGEVLTLVEAAFPAHASELRTAAARFDAVVYGRHPVSTLESSETLALDDRLRRERPDHTRRAVGRELAVPR